MANLQIDPDIAPAKPLISGGTGDLQSPPPQTFI